MWPPDTRDVGSNVTRSATLEDTRLFLVESNNSLKFNVEGLKKKIDENLEFRETRNPRRL
jgi:hypothetical protein